MVEETIILDKKKVQQLSHKSKKVLIQKIYDFAEYLEDMDFVEQDKKKTDTEVSRDLFQKSLK